MGALAISPQASINRSYTPPRESVFLTVPSTGWGRSFGRFSRMGLMTALSRDVQSSLNSGTRFLNSLMILGQKTPEALETLDARVSRGTNLWLEIKPTCEGLLWEIAPKLLCQTLEIDERSVRSVEGGSSRPLDPRRDNSESTRDRSHELLCQLQHAA